MTERIPYTKDVPSAINPLPEGYGTAFESYEEAIEALKNWNNAYTERESEYLIAVENWRAECEKVKINALSKAVLKEYNEVSFELVPIYYEPLGIWTFGWIEKKTKKTVKVIPDYELPSKPEFDNTGYWNAKSAYCYLISDGLTKDEWRELRIVILNIYEIKKGQSWVLDDDIKHILDRLIEKRYIIITKRDKSFFDEFTGNEAKYNIDFTDEGYRYFTGLINRSWYFREGLVESAYNNTVINDTDYEKLLKANEKIKEELIKQLDKKKDWNWNGGTFWAGSYTNLPRGLLEAYESFDIEPEGVYTKGEFPYYHVLKNVPSPIEIPSDYLN